MADERIVVEWVTEYVEHGHAKALQASESFRKSLVEGGHATNQGRASIKSFRDEISRTRPEVGLLTRELDNLNRRKVVTPEQANLMHIYRNRLAEIGNEMGKVTRTAEKTTQAINRNTDAWGRNRQEVERAQKRWEGFDNAIDRITGRGIRRSISGLHEWATTLASIMLPAVPQFLTLLTQGLTAAGAAAVGAVASLQPLVAGLGGLAGAASAAGQAVGVWMLSMRDVDKLLESALFERDLDKFVKVLAKFTPEAQRFAVTVRTEVGPAIEGLQRAGQTEIFRGLNVAIQNLLPRMPLLEKAFKDTAVVIGDFIARAGRELGNADWARDFQTQTERNVGWLKQLEQAILPAARAFRDLVIAGGPVADWLVKTATATSQQISTFISARRATGQLGEDMLKARDRMALFWEMGKDLFFTFKNITSAAQDFGDWLVRSLGEQIDAWNRWTASFEGQIRIKQFFDNMKAPIEETGRLLADFAKVFVRVGETSGFDLLARQLRTEFLPVLEDVLVTVNREMGPQIITTLTQVTEAFANLMRPNFGAGMVFQAIEQVARFINFLSSHETTRGVLAVGIGLVALYRTLRLISALTLGRTISDVTGLTAKLQTQIYAWRGVATNSEAAANAVAASGARIAATSAQVAASTATMGAATAAAASGAVPAAVSRAIMAGPLPSAKSGRVTKATQLQFLQQQGFGTQGIQTNVPLKGMTSAQLQQEVMGLQAASGVGSFIARQQQQLQQQRQQQSFLGRFGSMVRGRGFTGGGAVAAGVGIVGAGAAAETAGAGGLAGILGAAGTGAVLGGLTGNPFLAIGGAAVGASIAIIRMRDAAKDFADRAAQHAQTLEDTRKRARDLREERGEAEDRVKQAQVSLRIQKRATAGMLMTPEGLRVSKEEEKRIRASPEFAQQLINEKEAWEELRNAKQEIIDIDKELRENQKKNAEVHAQQVQDIRTVLGKGGKALDVALRGDLLTAEEEAIKRKGVLKGVADELSDMAAESAKGADITAARYASMAARIIRETNKIPSKIEIDVAVREATVAHERDKRKGAPTGPDEGGNFAGGGRVTWGVPTADMSPAMLARDEFVVTGHGERVLESMTGVPGVLNWLEGVQQPHFRAGGRSVSGIRRFATGGRAPGPGSSEDRTPSQRGDPGQEGGKAPVVSSAETPSKKDILTAGQIKGHASAVKIPKGQLNIATAIALGESSGNRFARALTSEEDSRGLWQINTFAHPWSKRMDLYNARTNAQAMKRVSGTGTNWNPWSVYTSGAYKNFLAQAGAAKTSGAAGSPTGAVEDVPSGPRDIIDILPGERFRAARERFLEGIQRGLDPASRRLDILPDLRGLGIFQQKASSKKSFAGDIPPGTPKEIRAKLTKLMSVMTSVDKANYPYVYGGGHVQPSRPTGGSGPEVKSQPVPKNVDPQAWAALSEERQRDAAAEAAKTGAGFDCSGAVAYVMQQAGFDFPTVDTMHFPNIGWKKGKGKNLTIWNRALEGKKGHMYMEILGKAWGTSIKNQPGGGPGFIPNYSRGADFVPWRMAGYRRGGRVRGMQRGGRTGRPPPRGPRFPPFNPFGGEFPTIDVPGWIDQWNRMDEGARWRRGRAGNHPRLPRGWRFSDEFFIQRGPPPPTPEEIAAENKRRIAIRMKQRGGMADVMKRAWGIVGPKFFPGRGRPPSQFRHLDPGVLGIMSTGRRGRRYIAVPPSLLVAKDGTPTKSAVGVLLHEWAHAFQKNPFRWPDWKTEGGAEAFAENALPGTAKALGITGPRIPIAYDAFVKRVRKTMPESWIMGGQFTKAGEGPAFKPGSPPIAGRRRGGRGSWSWMRRGMQADGRMQVGGRLPPDVVTRTVSNRAPTIPARGGILAPLISRIGIAGNAPEQNVAFANALNQFFVAIGRLGTNSLYTLRDQLMDRISTLVHA